MCSVSDNYVEPRESTVPYECHVFLLLSNLLPCGFSVPYAGGIPAYLITLQKYKERGFPIRN